MYSRVFACGEDTFACRLQASLTRSARGLRTSRTCIKQVPVPEVELPRHNKKPTLKVGDEKAGYSPVAKIPSLAAYKQA